MKITSGKVSPAAAAWAITGILAVAALGLWLGVARPGPLPIDRVWHGLMAEPGPAARAVAIALAEAGSALGGAACAAIAIAALCALRRVRDALSLAFAMGVGVFMTELLRVLVARPRPTDPLYAATSFSFPSGHSAGAAALATSVLLIVLGWRGASRAAIRWATVGAVAWVLLMMWSRTALHLHWLTDTAAGAVLGISAAVLSRRLWIGERSLTRRA